jgi:peptidoglycan/LPS O-acetylase OafA/YrhL
LLALPFGLAIYYLAYTKSRLAVALSVPTVFMLGEASYAMYILHYPIGQWMVHYLPRVLGGTIMNGPIMFACYLAVVIGCSILSLQLLERPARRAIVRAFRRPTRRTTATVDQAPATTVPTASR